jgi:hypothetical protein
MPPDGSVLLFDRIIQQFQGAVPPIITFGYICTMAKSACAAVPAQLPHLENVLQE